MLTARVSVATLHIMQDVRDVLAAIPYNENDVWLHTDATLMPRNRAAWASWNFLGRCNLKSEIDALRKCKCVGIITS